jgi:hypothetical protein
LLANCMTHSRYFSIAPHPMYAGITPVYFNDPVSRR